MGFNSWLKGLSGCCCYPMMLFSLEFQPSIALLVYGDAYLYSTSRLEHYGSATIAEIIIEK
jgi:hypothetical protein